MVIIYLLLVFTYLLIKWHVPLLIPFSTIGIIEISVNNFNFTSVFFKATCQANQGAQKNFAGSNCLNSFYCKIDI